MMVHHETRRIYLAHARVASRSTELALERVGFETVFGLGRHAQLYDKASPVTREARDAWTVATTVRDHWDAAVSWILWDLVEKPLHRDPWSIPELERVFRMAKNYIRGDQMYGLHLDDADVILRFETLEADLVSWVGPLELEHRGRSDRRAELGNMTLEAYAYIGSRFANEIDLLEYGR